MSIFTIILAACAGTRSEQPEVSVGELTKCPSSPNCVSNHTWDEAHRITPLVFKDEPESALDRYDDAG